jgi:glycosyltransferase involved in cell wall biosynthesis
MSASPLRVLAITSTGTLGGAELALAEFLRRRPPAVEVSCLLVEDGPLRARLAQLGVPTWVASGFEGRPGLREVVRFTRSLRDLLGRLVPDVVLAVGLKAAFLAAPGCRLAHVPIAWQKVDLSLDAALARPLAAAVNGVISVSDAAAAALGPLRARRLLAVVGPPVRLSDEVTVTPRRRPPTIGTLGTLMPVKGQTHIIEAAALLSEEFPELRVVLAGSASEDFPDHPQKLVALAARLGIAERVELCGFVEDVAAVLEQLTVFVSATYRDEQGYGSEGLGAATLEAGWVGLPVVATRGGGAPEGIVDGLTGTLADPADPRALAAAIAPYLRDHRLAVAAGEAGRRFTRERFCAQELAGRLFGVLAELARSQSARARS